MSAIAPAFPVLDIPAHAGHDECGFPGATEAEANCREIPVATISETCGHGHMGLLPCCAGHAAEVAGWDSFIGDPDIPGVLTCARCAAPLRIALLWDDMSPAQVIQ